MTDLELIFLVLAGFYLWECAVWLRPGMVLFTSALGGRHRARTIASGAFLFNAHGGLVLGHLFPAGNSLRAESWPFSLALEGVYGGVRQDPAGIGRSHQSEAYFPWDRINTIETAERTVLVNGIRFVEVGSAALARHLTGLLTHLKGLPPERRGKAIAKALARGLDTLAIRNCVQETDRGTELLQVTCWVLFGFLFLYCPYLLVRAYSVTFLQVLTAYVGLLVVALVHFSLIHRQLRPQEASERSKQLGIMAIFPADAVHARDHLWRDALTTYHPLAVAAVVCRRPDFLEMARLTWLDLCYPMPTTIPAGRSGARAAEAAFHERWKFAVEEFFAKNEIDPAVFLVPPSPESPECHLFCPRCRGQFVLREGTCHVCQLALLPLAAASQAITRVP